MTDETILLLASASESTNILFHTLSREYHVGDVIIETKSLGSKKKFWMNRVRSLGLLRVLGQIAFLATWAPVLRATSQRRIREIKDRYHLDSSEIIGSRITRVPNINSDQTIRLLRDINPRLVVINGTSILSRELIESIPAPIVNIHAGITPTYRGVHGAYWALARQDPEQCGVTVHFVDPGIDTGTIIAQATISPTPEDNYATYPYLQLAEGVRLINGIVRGIFDHTVVARSDTSAISKCWSHPTLWEYLSNRINRNVR